MKSILSEIYDGEYSRLNRSCPVENELACKLSGLEDELIKEIPEALREKFLEYTTACAEFYRAGSKEDFKEGFRLAMRLMKEAEMTGRVGEEQGSRELEMR